MEAKEKKEDEGWCKRNNSGNVISYQWIRDLGETCSECDEEDV